MASVKVQVREPIFQSQSRATASAKRLMSAEQVLAVVTPIALESGSQNTLNP